MPSALAWAAAQLSEPDRAAVVKEVEQIMAAAAAGLPLDRVDPSPAMERLAVLAEAEFRQHRLAQASPTAAV